MRATAFTILLALALYFLFVVGDTWLGYWILAGAFVVWLYGIFRASLGHE